MTAALPANSTSPAGLIHPNLPGSIRICGMDPSLNNWGWCLGYYELSTKKITISQIGLTQPVLLQQKQVRVNSADIYRANQLSSKAVQIIRQAQVTFVEVPIGSQNARSMASYGICVGILGTLRAGGLNFFEVYEQESKLATVGKKVVTKAETIAWAVKNHPEVAWPTYKRSGTVAISESQAEHMADAIAAVHAGISSVSFQQLLPMLASSR